MKKHLLTLFAVLFIQISMFAQNPGIQDSVIRILAIGNSFSEDGVETYLHELADAGNKKIIIGNMYIGGAPLSLHLENSKNGAANYSYRKIGLDGIKKTKEKISLAQALTDEPWDYISFQQVSSLSGKYEVIMQSLPDLTVYVRKKVGTKPQFIYHQTWAYQHDSKHEGFAIYDKNQRTMYRAIAKTTKRLKKEFDFAFIVPAGTAIQNGRTSSIGDNFTRDGYHLQLDYGRFTAACAWYEKLFNLDVRQNSYIPTNVNSEQATIAKAAAHNAIKRPFKISKIKL
ncbi:MAG: DUF4886 domain-containing protein [Sphingobacterium sp.]|uniref:DUF4886 domain-containing protein n=1 Tax=Sphingobacterium sp. JB170 TaxID=1434842 RepID=UPI00097F3970|nr:DUF4886 domain-containing protein [Sphingobacterium sp. JB170]SJN43410.1 hypothetical protein-signal peptide and transmembrane prediction [Sphingobacterium sp. JB170]